MKKVSLIIPVYNRLDELALTLDSVLMQTLPKEDFEVVIADDGSGENVESLLENYPQLDITYCRQEDKGFRVAAVRNLGMKNAKGDLLVFNDNGILLSPAVLERHVAWHSKQENLLVLGYMFGTDWQADTEQIGKLLAENPVWQAIEKMKELGGMGDGREGYLARFGEDIASWYIPWLALWGGHFSVRHAFTSKNGIAFDEEFTSWGGEDNDFGIQLCRAGAEYRLARDIEVVHYPTPNRANSDIQSEDFQAHYKLVKNYIAEKHASEDVLVWRALGSSANDPAKRQPFLEQLCRETKHE